MNKLKVAFNSKVWLSLTQIDIQSQTTNASYNEIAEIIKKAAKKVLDEN